MKKIESYKSNEESFDCFYNDYMTLFNKFLEDYEIEDCIVERIIKIYDENNLIDFVLNNDMVVRFDYKNEDYLVVDSCDYDQIMFDYLINK